VDASRVIPSLRANDRWAAIDELIQQLIISRQIAARDRDAIFDAIRLRESTRSTGIGAGIAIPHARSPLIPEVVWAFGRSRAGIPFDAFDNQLVRFVFLFLVPEAQFEQHVQTLARIARAFKGDQVLHDLAIAPDALSILKVLESRL
jgi:mannitol/fructose-specific phosphotransferase system IIA component (Ntr-type)